VPGESISNTAVSLYIAPAYVKMLFTYCTFYMQIHTHVHLMYTEFKKS